MEDRIGKRRGDFNNHRFAKAFDYLDIDFWVGFVNQVDIALFDVGVDRDL